MLTNQSFVFTGSLKNFSRTKAKDIILELGANVSNTLSKKTNYLVAGEKPGSKIKYAQELNIPIIKEKEFLEIIDKNKN